MFESNLVEDFMDPQVLDNMEKKDKVAEAFYIFVYKLLPCINEIWRSKMTDNHIYLRTNIFDVITPSDEAFVRWVINCKIDSIHELKQTNYELDNTQKGKKKGPHDSSKEIEEYIRIHNTIMLLRDNETMRRTWNELFWNTMEAKHTDKILLTNTLNLKKQRTNEEVNETRAKLPKLDDNMSLYQL